MFRIVSERLAWWPVTFPGVAEDGQIIENRIELRFVILDEDAFPEFLSRLVEARPGAEDQTMPPSALGAELLGDVIRDWRGVAAENGEALPYNADNLRALLRVPGTGGAIGRAYVACRNATPEIREGN